MAILLIANPSKDADCCHLHIERIYETLYCCNCGQRIDDSEWIDNYTPEDEELR